MRMGTRLALVVIALGLLAGGVKAATLGLTKGVPDITISAIDVSYNATSDVLKANGLPSGYDLDGVPPVDYAVNGLTKTFALSASIDATGVLFGGSFQIDGRIVGLGITPVTTLLKGNLTAFGYSPVANSRVLEFRFDVTGGALQSAFGSKGGMILNLGSTGFPGYFSNDFANAPRAGSADAFAVVPLPLAGPAGMVLLAGIALRRRMSSR